VKDDDADLRPGRNSPAALLEAVSKIGLVNDEQIRIS